MKKLPLDKQHQRKNELLIDTEVPKRFANNKLATFNNEARDYT